jgi:transaldolase
MRSKLDQLRDISVVVADTDDQGALRAFQPVGCTTNPSLVRRAAQASANAKLVEQAIAWGCRRTSSVADQARQAARYLAVLVGREAARLVSGRVSIGVDPRLYFNKEGTEVAALDLIAQCEAVGVGRSRLLIEIAATWEGIQAARRLQTKGVDCNLTLVFCEVQALAAADAGAFVISPLVGAVAEWHRARLKPGDSTTDDRGVGSVVDVYRTFKAQRRRTHVMAGSFRSIAQIEALAGCDLLAIAPSFLRQLADEKGALDCLLYAGDVERALPTAPISESAFRYALNQDAMATECLSESVRGYVADVEDLERWLVRLIVDPKSGRGQVDFGDNRPKIVA